MLNGRVYHNLGMTSSSHGVTKQIALEIHIDQRDLI